MKAFKRFTMAFAAVLTFLAASCTTVFADEAPGKGYTYNVTITTGFEDVVFSPAASTGASDSGIEGASNSGVAKLEDYGIEGASGSDKAKLEDYGIEGASDADKDKLEEYGTKVELSSDGTVMYIRNVPYGVSLHISDAINNIDVSKTIYHVKGLRQAGHNETLSNVGANELTTNAGVIYVTGDADYVVAYGVLTNPVNYTVNYVDEDGNELLDPDTFIGNAGEKIQVAFRYVDGYMPDAYRKNLTLHKAEELESDPDCNTITFVYHPSNGVNIIYNSITGEATYVYEDGTTTTVVVPAENVTPGAAIAGGAGAGANAGAGADANAGGENVIEDEQTPLVTQDVVDLDDEEVPLADKAAGTLVNAAPIIAAVIVVIAIAGIVTIVVMSRKRKPAKVDTKNVKDEK